MRARPSCPLCGADAPVLVADRVRFDRAADVHRCRECGLTFLDPESFRYPADFYEKEYHQTYLTHVDPSTLDPKAYFEKMKKATRIWADRFRGLLGGSEVVLDVGCSTGHFIDLVKDRAARIVGSDLNEREVEFCRREVGVLATTDAPWRVHAPGTFDYITMIFVLEHIADPKTFLASLAPLLKPGGKFVIVVPNVADALVSFYDIPEFRRFYYSIEHLFYYDQRTIRRLFGDLGLSGTVETVQEYPITNHLQWAYRRGPSDILASRQGLPDVGLAEGAPEAAWREFWEDVDRRYRELLARHGHGDRLWCVVGR